MTERLTDERDELVEVVEPRLVSRYELLGSWGGMGGVLGLRKGGEDGWWSVSSNWREEDSVGVMSEIFEGGRWAGVLTEMGGRTRTKGDGRRVGSKGPPPEMMLGNRLFDKRTAWAANVWLKRRRKVFTFPRTENGKRERLCPNSDRRGSSFGKVFRVDFSHGREIGIVFPSSDKGCGTRFDLAEESGRWLRFPEVNREAVEVEERLVEGVDVVLVIDVRVQVGGPFQRCGGRPGGGKVY
jgi:hypothetical protein